MIKLLRHNLKKLFSPKYLYLRRFKVRSGDIVIDLGANIGEVTDYFLRKGAIVCAYEPNPYAFKILEERFQGHRNATLHQAAVSNYNGQAELWLHRDHVQSEVNFSQASSLLEEKGNLSKDSLKVAVVDIADVLLAYPFIKLIKIDIEGGEYEIIDTILKYADKIDYILLETHGKKYESFAQKETVLQEKIRTSPFRNKIFTDWF